MLLLLPGGAVWGADQPPLSKIPVPAPRTNAELAQPQFSELARYVKDVPSAIALGKALFWDMQAGSDGNTACASCHYRAGADPINVRSRNQLHPGFDDAFDVLSGPSTTLTDVAFPFFQVIPQTARLAIDPLTGLIQDAILNPQITRNFNDVAGSQGVLKTAFVSINTGSAIDNGTPVLDPIFNIGGGAGGNVRQVTGRNSPSVLNTVFNYANFWDGRGNNIFNGVNPFGPADQSARIWRNNGGLQQEQVAIPNASLASQAVGPPLNEVEMSFAGRTFPEFGRKMLNLPRPLDQQAVHAEDSVLSGLRRNPTGLNTDYRTMIQNAFVDDLWNDNSPSIPVSTVSGTVNFAQMEANFSLFWGLSIMLYEATLVSDQTPFDRFVAGNLNAMGLGAQAGHSRFNSQCARCHSGSELSDASIGTASTIGSAVPNCFFDTCNPPAFTSNTNHTLIKLDDTAILGGLSDAGFLNLGLRPMTDDAGRAGTTPDTILNPANGNLPFPLSFTLLGQLGAQAPPLLPQDIIDVTPSLATPLLLASFVSAASPAAVQGTFKTPGLRNVELTAPYFHNGSMDDLQEVVEFYARGGNFPNAPENPTLAARMKPIGSLRIQGGPDQQNMKAFLASLTDERVRNEKAPFDHPELRIPSGDPADTPITLPATGGTTTAVLIEQFNMATAPTTTQSINIIIGGDVRDSTTNAVLVPLNNDVTVEVIVNGLPNWATVNQRPLDTWTFAVTPLTGLKMGTNTLSAIASTSTGETQTIDAAFDLLPTAIIFGAPLGGTKLTNATLGVTGNSVSSYRFSVDGGAFSAETPVGELIVLSGLADGFHTVSVVGTAVVGTTPFVQPEANATTASWTVKTIPPVLTLNAVATPTRGTAQTISGTVELGLAPKVLAEQGVTVGPVQVIGGVGIATWSCELSGLKKGTNTITVTATDIAFNVTTAASSITVALPDGSFSGAASPSVVDAVKALRIAVNLETPTAEDLLRGDVSPLDANGVPVGDGAIGVEDALLILKKAVGLVNF